MNCPVCHSARTTSYYRADMPHILSACSAETAKKAKVLPFEAHLCLDCFLGFNASRLSASALKSIYDDYAYISPRRGIGASKFEGMLATIKRHLSPADEILDVGCSEGYLLERLREVGYAHLTGLEPGPQAEEARKIGLDVRRGYFHARSFPGRRFDGIILMHVFEHFADPAGMLKALAGKLTKTGKLIIEVPDFGGYHHQHLFFYTFETLRGLVREASLTVTGGIRDGAVIRLTVGPGPKMSTSHDTQEFNRATTKNRAAFLMGDLCRTTAKLRALFTAHKSVHWWGAGSSSVMWLNQIGAGILKRAELTVVDGDSAKWGLYIPGVNVEVKPYSILAGETVDLMIIASEFSDEIKATMRANRIQAKKIEVVT